MNPSKIKASMSIMAARKKCPVGTSVSGLSSIYTVVMKAEKQVGEYFSLWTVFLRCQSHKRSVMWEFSKRSRYKASSPMTNDSAPKGFKPKPTRLRKDQNTIERKEVLNPQMPTKVTLEGVLNKGEVTLYSYAMDCSQKCGSHGELKKIHR